MVVSQCPPSLFILVYQPNAQTSIKSAAQGDDENIDNKDDPEIRKLYDRNHPQYPYRSHGQYLRAFYALTGCVLLVLFNGWRTVVSPISVADFFACYIPVC
jgi:yeast amino acid transporter